MQQKLRNWLFVLGLAGFSLSLEGQVVFNEIFYHAPEDLNDLQWIELHNWTDRPINLDGWKIVKGVKYAFKDSIIAPKGYLVICKNRERFQEFYDAAVAGEFEKSLKRSGERLELLDANGKLVDMVSFEDHAPWPVAADGESASLERICPEEIGNLAENWASSPWSEDGKQPAGTPGQRNANYSAVLPPVVTNVSSLATRAEPNGPIQVQATVQDKFTLPEVTLRYSVVGPGSKGEEIAVAMSKANQRYTATIPGQKNGSVVRFRIQAVNQKGAQRFFPGENGPQPALSYWVQTNATPGSIPLAYFINTDPGQQQSLAAQRSAPAEGRQGPFRFPGGNRDRMMAERQLQADLDLPGLWVALTLSNAPASALEALQPIFSRLELDRARIQKTVLESTNLQEKAKEVPRIIGAFTTQVRDSVKPVLDGQQTKHLESWMNRAPAPERGFGFRRDPAATLRNLLPLEAAYFYFSTRTNTEPRQLASVRDLYREAVQARDALTEEAGQFGGPPMMDRTDGREEFEAKVQAIGANLQRKLRTVLKPQQLRQLAAFRLPENNPFGGSKTSRHLPGTSVFVLVDPQTAEPKIFDFVQITERSGGYKVRLGKGQRLDGYSVLNVVFRADDRRALTEPLAYELHRRAGSPIYFSDHVRLSIDGEPIGYHYVFGQPNKHFLTELGLKDNGNLYKAYWLGRGLVGQHMKKSNPDTDHDDLVKLVEQLQSTRTNAAAQWALIQREFEVDQWINQYAVRMILADWDGFFNNYFLYDDLGGTKKWSIYVWDQEKTFGDYDGMREGGLLYDMPTTFGAEGDKPPGGENGMGMRMGSWWRAGGYLSKPLLANPQFRARYLSRVKDLLGAEFTEAKLFPLIDQYGERLKHEVAFRAIATKEDPLRAQERLGSNLASIKQFVTKRRDWLLAQEEVRNAGPYRQTEK